VTRVNTVGARCRGDGKWTVSATGIASTLHATTAASSERGPSNKGLQSDKSPLLQAESDLYAGPDLVVT